MEKMDKFKIAIYLAFKAFLIAAICLALFKRNWFNLWMSSLTLILSYLPNMFQKKFKIEYPSEFELMILFFLFGSFYLGDIHGFYEKFWWWDIMLHTSSGFMIGFFAYSLVYVLNKELDFLDISPFFVSLFSFSFAVALGVMWEIFEFFFDNTLGYNLQRRETGLFDTMLDLIVDSVGALIISVSCYFYLRFGKITFFTHKFAKRNSHLFKKKSV